MTTLNKYLINFNLIVTLFNIEAHITEPSQIYATRHPALLQTFLEHTNEKEASIQALFPFLSKFNMAYPDYFKNNLKICDIGCGEGSFTLQLLKMIGNFHDITNISYIGVDRQLKLILSCKEIIQKAGLANSEFYQNNFQDIDLASCNLLSNFMLTSHSCYSMSDCNSYIEKLKNISLVNTLAIFIHNIDSPVNVLQAKIGHILLRAKQHGNVTEKIAYALTNENITYITINFTSCMSFPKLTEEEWNFFYEKIEQNKYDINYKTYSTNLMIAKNLIDFSITEPLEAFDSNQRKIILDEFKKLINHENKITYTNAIQIGLIKPDNSEIRNAFEDLKNNVLI